MLHNFTINPYLLQANPASFLAHKENPGLPDFVIKPAPSHPSYYPIRVLVIGIPEGVT